MDSQNNPEYNNIHSTKLLPHYTISFEMFFRFLICWVLFEWYILGAETADQSVTPTNGWDDILPLHKFGNKSYYLGNIFRATYLQAAQFCHDVHMDLVSVESKEENTFLYELIQKDDGSYEKESEKLNKLIMECLEEESEEEKVKDSDDDLEKDNIEVQEENSDTEQEISDTEIEPTAYLPYFLGKNELVKMCPFFVQNTCREFDNSSPGTKNGCKRLEVCYKYMEVFL
ncbi:hypothetical protein JTB14_005782 [Gonioctena quinquepunctata]|nr:hypothetical protein JTB14_005782 [Gonioctena quinquepunctata]